MAVRKAGTYEAYGFKMKDGKKVPNCVPEKKERT
jgi:hypothetical protein